VTSFVTLPRHRHLSGFEHWTLRCTKCGNVHQAQVAIDPMKSDAMGWLDSELVPPK